MEALRIIIADDEQEARELILHYLEQSNLSYIPIEAPDGRSALQLLEQESPDILFLDIRMPELSGIEVLEQRVASPLPAIIFTTAFDEFALPAFDYEATDYLLKPFDQARFDKALEKASRYIHFIKNADKSGCLRQLSIKKGSKTVIVPVDEIEFFEADGSYVQVNANGKNWLMNTPLYEMETRLDPGQFLRIHRSVILNTDFVKEILSLPNGDFNIKLQNGKELRGSRTYKRKIRDHFML